MLNISEFYYIILSNFLGLKDTMTAERHKNVRKKVINCVNECNESRYFHSKIGPVFTFSFETTRMMLIKMQ